jgi:hypothetical protein
MRPRLTSTLAATLTSIFLIVLLLAGCTASSLACEVNCIPVTSSVHLGQVHPGHIHPGHVHPAAVRSDGATLAPMQPAHQHHAATEEKMPPMQSLVPQTACATGTAGGCAMQPRLQRAAPQATTPVVAVAMTPPSHGMVAAPHAGRRAHFHTLRFTQRSPRNTPILRI